jgi:hypothetical protein
MVAPEPSFVRHHRVTVLRILIQYLGYLYYKMYYPSSNSQ